MSKERLDEILAMFATNDYQDIYPLPYTLDSDETNRCDVLIAADGCRLYISGIETDSRYFDTLPLLAAAPSIVLELVEALKQQQQRIAELESGQMVMVTL